MGSPTLQSGGKNQKWPTSGPGGYITPAVWGSPMLQTGGQNQMWPTSGPGGYNTPAVWDVPTTPERGSKTKVADKWAWWLHHRCCLGGPQRFRARNKNKKGPQVGLVAKGPLPFGRSPTLQCGGQKQKWPTSGPGGYITVAVWGSLNALEHGTEIKVAHKWA